MNNSHRNRIQSLNSKLSSSQPKDTIEKLKVIIPPPATIKNGDIKQSTCLRPLQTNTKEKPIFKNKITYKLVEDKDVPTIIKDYKHKVQYKKLECLGSGAFGRVYRVVTIDNKYFAAKVVSKHSLLDVKVKNKLLAEINIHRTLKHQNIVRYYNYIEDKYNIYLVLELCENKTLAVMVKNRGGYLTELEVKFFMAQLFTALRYISDNRILHRDLKMSNILLDANMNIKIGDFGLAALLLNKNDRKRTICGTPHYIAPEILFNEGHDHRVDMWSAGVLMFNLLFGKQPFPQSKPKEFYHKLKSNELYTQYKFPPDSESMVSKEAKDLISKLLVNDPDLRMSIVEALQHPFFLSAIPDKIPKSALYRPPEYKDLFENLDLISNSQRRNKLALEVDRAKDIHQSFIDLDINPPLNILEEVIYDPRSQYPIESDTSLPSLISKKRNNSNNSQELKKQIEIKRVCNDNDNKSKAASNKPFAVPTALPNRKPMMEEMVDNLKIMIKRASLSKRSESILNDANYKWGQDNIFIETWVDCSRSYGFAYCLSDGTLGFLYNDGSTITSHAINHYYYIFHRTEDNRYVEQEYTSENIPAELQKKCAVLNKFREYEGTELKHDHIIPKTNQVTKVHLFKYFVSDIAIAFRLNNGVIQLNFFKHHKLILYDKGMKLIFIDPSGKLNHYHTFDVLTSNRADMKEALNYAYTILEEQNMQRQEALRKERWKRFNN